MASTPPGSPFNQTGALASGLIPSKPGAIKSGMIPTQKGALAGGQLGTKTVTKIVSVKGPGGMSGYTKPATGPATYAPGTSPAEVRAMQQFLVNKGFQLSVDGINGPITKSAAAWFRGQNGIHGNGEAWNAAHGIGTHPAASAAGPTDTPTSENGGGTSTGTSTGSTGSDQTGSAFNKLLAALLGTGGRVGSLVDPGKVGAAAEAPDTAAAQTLLRQISANGTQEAQNQSDISSWYGLNPQAKSYQLSVLGRLGQAGAADQQFAGQTAASDTALAQALAGSIGGSANAGSNTVAAAGADAAGAANAIGQVQAGYAQNMDPLIAAEARGQMSREKATNSQNLLQLRDQLATAQGQGQADRMSAVLGAQKQNADTQQQRFANRGNLLSTMSQLMAVDPNYSALKDAHLAAEIQSLEAGAYKDTHPVVKPAKPGPQNFATSTPDQRKSFTSDLLGAISAKDSSGNLVPKQGLTRAQAQAVADRLAKIYWPQTGIPQGSGVIASAFQQIGLH